MRSGGPFQPCPKVSTCLLLLEGRQLCPECVRSPCLPKEAGRSVSRKELRLCGGLVGRGAWTLACYPFGRRCLSVPLPVWVLTPARKGLHCTGRRSRDTGPKPNTVFSRRPGLHSAAHVGHSPCSRTAVRHGRLRRAEGLAGQISSCLRRFLSLPHFTCLPPALVAHGICVIFLGLPDTRPLGPSPPCGDRSPDTGRLQGP